MARSPSNALHIALASLYVKLLPGIWYASFSVIGSGSGCGCVLNETSHVGWVTFSLLIINSGSVENIFLTSVPIFILKKYVIPFIKIRIIIIPNNNVSKMDWPKDFVSVFEVPKNEKIK